MSWIPRMRALQAATAIAALLVACAAHAQTWQPAKAIEIVIPTTPGGGMDRSGRTLQRILQEGGLSTEEVADMRRQLHERPGAQIGVDLAEQTVTDPAGVAHRFEIHAVRKKCLLEGLDDIARTHQYAERFAMFEDGYRGERPWLYEPPA